jgi:hypothetical protein
VEVPTMQSLTQSPRGVECNRPVPPRIVHDQEAYDATAADLRRIADRCEAMGLGRTWQGTNPAELLRTIADAVEYDAVSHGAAF